MTDWFDNLPAGWEVSRLKNIIESTQTGVWGDEPRGDDDDIRCVRVADFDRPRSTVGSVDTFRSVTQKDREGRLLELGDILLEKSGGTDNNPVGFSVMFSGTYPAVSSNFITRLRMKRTQLPRFWLYALDASYATKRTERSVRRTTGIQNLDQKAFFDDVFPVPPLAEQRAIADFLDQEAARVDQLVEEQERLIRMLLERRQAVIDLAFEASPKNSRIAHGCIDVVDCPHTTPPVAEDGSFEAVRTASVRAGRFRHGYGLPVSEETWRERNAKGSPSLGDILFAREGGSAGEAAMVPSADICLGQRMVLLRIEPHVCVGEFLLWQICSSRIQDHFRLATSGAAAGNIRLPVLRRTPIWLPTVQVQREVADDLTEKITRIDAVIAETQRFIELARERRSALITAAVTGQIDVRNEVA